MIEMKFYRTGVLPGTLEANAFYLVRNVDNGQLEITATGADAVPVKAITQSQILSLIEANNPETADSLTTARTISMTGDANWAVSFDGSKNESGVITFAATGVVAGEYQAVTVDAKGRVTAARALTQADIPNLNGSKIISDITVNTSGNAATATLAMGATKLATPRTINDVAFDGSANITINAVDSTARIAASEKGAINGVATLGADGKVPATQLPSYVDDVIEVDAYDKLPGQINDPGTNGAASKGKIYVVAIEGDTFIYRWSGSAYIEIPDGVGTADSAVKLSTARNIAITGDATWSVSFDGSANASGVLTLANTGIAAGTYAGITFDAKGRATAARALIEADMPNLTYAKVLSSQSVIVNGNW